MKFKNMLILFVGAFLTAICHAGGLQSGTDALTQIKTWLFAFVGIAALVYLLVMVLMALMERKQWGDVAMALVHCALAGGAVAGGTWALSLFQ